MSSAPVPEYLSPEALAELLDVPLGAVRKWRHEGTGPAGFRVGKHVRYAREDVDAWIAAQRAGDRVSARSVA